MILDKEKLYPLNVFGGICLFGVVFSVFTISADESTTFKVFVAVMSALHLLVAMGIFLRTLWGFKLLKGYLYVLLIGFPIGTLTARYLLRHIEQNNLQSFFGKRSLEL